jgi:hypothetical protein
VQSFQISITPNRRAAGRYVTRVRRSLQKALAEENKKRGLTQSDIARAIGVHRSVINRELSGRADITLGRVAELAWAMGRTPTFDLPERVRTGGANIRAVQPQVDTSGSALTVHPSSISASSRPA